MRVALACCGRLENRYAVEFVEYYKQLGFDHIYIADNNYNEEEHFEDVLQSYVDDNFITIYDYRNVQYLQCFFYIESYNKLNKLYDWIFFCDFDEYLTLVEDNNIKDYLSRDCFKNVNQILINWKIYSDNDLVYDDGRPLLERFTKESTNKKLIWGWNENHIIKSFIRGGINDIKQSNIHFMYNDLLNVTTCNNEGIKCKPNANTDIISYKLAYIKHFLTKTIDEWINNKLVRGVGDQPISEFKKHYNIDRFFKYNELTQSKINYLNKYKIKYNKMNCCYIFTTNANKDNNKLYKDLLLKSIDTLLLFYDNNIKNIYILIDNKITPNEYGSLVNNINEINNNRVNIIYKLIDLNITNCIKYPENNMNSWKINRIGLLKFFIPYLVDCDNILYIDIDILFNKNIIYNIFKDFDDYETLFKIYQCGYNSGLILFNCNKWRSLPSLLNDIIQYYTETENINTVDNQTFGWLANQSKYKDICVKDNNYKINFPLTPPDDNWKNAIKNEIYDWHNMNILHMAGVEYKTYVLEIYNYIKNNC